MKMTFYYHANKTHFHNKGFALGLVLRVRVFGTRKWPIKRLLEIKAATRMTSHDLKWRYTGNNYELMAVSSFL